MSWLWQDDPKNPDVRKKMDPKTDPKPVPPSNILTTNPGVIDSPSDLGIYQSLKAKVNFDATDMGQLLAKYLAPLRKVKIDEHAKYAAAIAQGESDGLTVAKILATFDGLKHQLQQETERFEKEMADFEAENVAGKKADRDALQAKLNQLNAEILAAQTKVGSARVDFQQTVAAIGKDLDAQKAKYAELLKD